jgi:hypothetical protein
MDAAAVTDDAVARESTLAAETPTIAIVNAAFHIAGNKPAIPDEETATATNKPAIADVDVALTNPT